MRDPLSLIRKPDSEIKREELISRWKSRYDFSNHKRKPDVARWARWERYIDDEMWSSPIDKVGKRLHEVNELKSCIMSVMPYIILEPAVIQIRAYSPEDAPEAMIREKIARNIDRQHDLFEEFMFGVYDGLLYGNGIFKLSYRDDLMIGRPNLSSSLPSRSINIRSVPLGEIFPDFSVRKWKEQGYIIHESAVHYDDLLGNPAYKQSLVKKIRPSLTEAEVHDFIVPPGHSGEKEYVPIREIHSFRTGDVFITSDFNEKDWLYEGPELYGISPFKNLWFFPRPKVLWGDSLTQSIEEHIKELGEVYTFMMDRVGIEALLKVIYQAASFGPDEMDKLENPNHAYIATTEENPANAIHVVDFSTAKSQYTFQTAMAEIREVIRSVSGVTAQQRGWHEAGVETKAEAIMLNDASQIRSVLRQKMFSRFAADVVNDLLYISSLEYTPERLAKMAGLNPQYTYLLQHYGPHDRSKFVVDYGMTAANSRAERIQKLQIFQQLVGPYLNPAIIAQIAAEALDFEYSEEMIIYQALGLMPGGQGQGGGQQGIPQQGRQQAMGVLNSRIAQPGGSPM